jgi:hypothetical protein
MLYLAAAEWLAPHGFLEATSLQSFFRATSHERD